MTAEPVRPVAVLVPTLCGGGAERVMLTIAGGLARRGWPVGLVVVSATGERAADVPPGVELVDLGRRRVRWAVPGLVAYLRRRRPSCLLTTLNSGNLLALIASAAARTVTPVVIRAANVTSVKERGASSLSERAMFAVARRLYRRAHTALAPSPDVASDLASFASLERERVSVAPNPVVGPELLELSRAALEHQWFSTGQPPVVLGVGRLTPQKDFATLVRAFALVRAEFPCRLVIVGEGPERRNLESLAASLGLDDDVLLPGFDPNPWRYMSRSAVFVLSSVVEGLPSALIEALACGAPVVSTDCRGGPREILASGRYGTLVPVGDVTAMAFAVNVALRRRRPPARRASWERYSLDAALDTYADVVGRVAGPVAVARVAEFSGAEP